jgi:hypothetical protein
MSGSNIKFMGVLNEGFKSEINIYWFEIKVLGLNLEKNMDCTIIMFYINMLTIILK